MPCMRTILMVLQNRPGCLDTRVWPQATALRDQGLQVCIISPKECDSDPTYTCWEGIHLYSYALPTSHNTRAAYIVEYMLSMLKTWWLSLRVLRHHGFDVIHAANPPDTFFFLHWFYRPLGKRFVFDQHDLSPELFYVKFRERSAFLHPVLSWLEKRSYRAGTIVLTTNESQRDRAITRGQCDPEKVIIVRNAPDLNRLYRVPSAPELKRGRPFLLIYAGAMEVQDGVEYALYALHELIYTHGRRDVSLALLGAGGRLPALKQLAHTLELDDYTHFTGWISDPEEIRRYLSTADLGLCPEPRNGFNELCTTVKSMEYMAFALPMVAFDLQETRATCQENALYATPNSVSDFARGIAQLLEEPGTRACMGERTCTLVQTRLNWDREKQNLLRAYAALFPELSTARLPDCEQAGPSARPYPGTQANRQIGAVIIGGDYQGLGIVRSLGKHGVPICVIDDERSISRFSRYTTHAVRVKNLRDERQTIETVLEVGRKRNLEGWVLFPTRDETVAAFARYRTELAEWFRVPTPELSVVEWAWDKRKTYQLAQELEIPIPRTWYPQSLDELNTIVGEPPFVVKPAIKEHFIYSTRAKAWRANSRAELAERFQQAAALVEPGEVMIQELIPGDGQQQFSCCMFFKDGQAVGSMVARRLRQHPSEFGRASTFVETVELPLLETLSLRFLQAIHYYGLVELEYKLDPRTGEYKLLDVNARTWGYHSLGQHAGVDFPSLLFADQLGEAVQICRAREGVKWVRLATDLSTGLVEILSRRLGAWSYLCSLKDMKAEAVFSRKDPLPGLVELALLPYLFVKRGF